MINRFMYKARVSSAFTPNVYPEPFTPAGVKLKGLE
jgi:hypothetical protein